MKTKYDSFASGTLPEGCRRCLLGKKLVLFISGICSRNCEYCPLSEKRKNSDKTNANERECKDINDLFLEVEKSGANSCGITGGDPLIVLDKTLEYAGALKKKYGKKFHIHIYLSTKLVTRDALEKLSKVVDEVRFHPELDGNLEEEIKKIAYAKEFYSRENIGIEIPLFPDKKEQTMKLVEKAKEIIGFLNLNELELGDSNFDWISKKYTLLDGGYTIKGSQELGLEIIRKFGKELSIHLCTARTKNWHQYRNRLKNYTPLKYGKMTDEGTVIYFSTKDEKIKQILNKKKYYFDEAKMQFILDPKEVERLIGKIKILKIEESPTCERDESEVEEW